MTGTGRANGKIVVCGILFWFPLAGVTYQFLHYLIGLRRLGYDVYYVEDTVGRWVYDPRNDTMSGDASANVAVVAPVLERYGLAGRWAFRGPGGRSYGMGDEQVARLYREADALLNVTAAHELRGEQLECKRRIYIESDPFSAQVLADAGDARTIAILDAHDTHFSFGENIGAPDCGVPLAGVTWLPTRQPVVLSLWDNQVGADAAPYTTIATWHNEGKCIDYRGDRYIWSKDRAFLEFLDVPRRVSVPFELASSPDPHSRARLEEGGWRLRNAVEVSATLEGYRSYICSSRGEFTVAREQYVRPRTGWFSDRSACYLAAGRPVITQETGFSKFLPTGEGLFAFTTIDDVLEALDRLQRNPAASCRAAREIAAEYFAAERVLGSLMERAGL